MIVSIHQPMFLPWTPYIAKLAYSDVFVVFDTVQYPGGKSFSNRNFIYQSKTPLLLTLPLDKHSVETLVQDIKINLNGNWYLKHSKSLSLSYSKKQNKDFLNKLLELLKPEQLTQDFTAYCIKHLELIIESLSLKTKLVRASELQLKGDGLDRIIEIVKSLNGTSYISGVGEGSMRYMDPLRFAKAGIELKKIVTNPKLFSYINDEPRDGAFIDLMLNLGDTSFYHLIEHTNIVDFGKK